MSPPLHFDDETQARPDELGASSRALRRHPVVSWTDATGSHSVVITARTLLGSAAGADLVVADPTVSRLHAELEPREDGLWVTDQESRNGTYVDGVLVTSARLREGSRLQCGASVLFVGIEATAREVELWPEDHFGPLVGRSIAMRELFARMARMAATDSTVLIQGETGTGKELVARAIHEASPRAAQPYVIVDCAALPDSLLEAELFGHARGAFTGAVDARVGAIEAAHGGTLFIDEIGEIPLAVQPKLLRVLETRTVRRLGETAHRRVDVRFVSATHKNLRAMTNAGAFREDLYFRLAVLPLTIPPLRARLDDLPLLVQRFLPLGKPHVLAPQLLHEIASRPWLGNVRELRNFVERALALGPHAALALAGDDHAAASGRGAASSGGSIPPDLLDATLSEARERWTQQLEREYVSQLLVRHDHNVSAVARAAGVDRSYVHRLIRKHGL